jgi:hypothetical protein
MEGHRDGLLLRGKRLLLNSSHCVEGDFSFKKIKTSFIFYLNRVVLYPLNAYLPNFPPLLNLCRLFSIKCAPPLLHSVEEILHKVEE